MLSALISSILLLFPVKTWTAHCLDTLAVNSQDYRIIIRQADKYITAPLPLVTDKTTTFSGNRHNYESLSTYYWPANPDIPNAPWVYRDGQKNPVRLKYDGEKINKFSSRMLTLAKAYYLTADSRYLDSWTSGIQAWFTDADSKMNPHFRYAQIVVNQGNNEGNYYGIIDGYVLINVVESIYLMQEKGQLPSRLNKKLKKWFRKLAQWMLKSPQGIRQDQAANNLSLAYDVMLYYFLTYAGQIDKAQSLITNLQNRRIAKQFMPDGSQPHELKRAKPIAYSLYNLEHLLDLCLIAQTQGNSDLYPSIVTPIAHAAHRYVQTLITQITQQPTIETPDLKSLNSTFIRLSAKLNYLDKQKY